MITWVVMKKLSDLGKLEFEVLRHIVTHGPASVGEVAGTFGEERGYARTTIQTVMERLRLKGMLDRQEKNGNFAYFSTIPMTSFYAGMVKDFIHDSLRDDVSPIVAYFAESKGLTPEEEELLRKLAAKISDD